MKVEFVTLGDAAKRLDVPGPTLRGWSDKLEELNVHYLERNHRDERIFYEEDMVIFQFMKEQKDKYKRKTTTTDLAYVIHEDDRFTCRQKGNVPDVPMYQTKLSEVDYEHILEHPEFKAFMSTIITSATSELSEGITEQVSERMKKEMDLKIEEVEARRIKKMDELLAEQRETKKVIQDYMNLPAYKKIFAKNPFK